jgi:hypothetical protein
VQTIEANRDEWEQGLAEEIHHARVDYGKKVQALDASHTRPRHLQGVGVWLRQFPGVRFGPAVRPTALQGRSGDRLAWSVLVEALRAE